MVLDRFFLFCQRYVHSLKVMCNSIRNSLDMCNCQIQESRIYGRGKEENELWNIGTNSFRMISPLVMLNWANATVKTQWGNWYFVTMFMHAYMRLADVNGLSIHKLYILHEQPCLWHFWYSGFSAIIYLVPCSSNLK